MANLSPKDLRRRIARDFKLEVLKVKGKDVTCILKLAKVSIDELEYTPLGFLSENDIENEMTFHNSNPVFEMDNPLFTYCTQNKGYRVAVVDWRGEACHLLLKVYINNKGKANETLCMIPILVLADMKLREQICQENNN